MSAPPHARAGRPAEPSAAIIDSRTLRSTPESGERAGYDGGKRKKGSKLHMAIDTLGHLLALHVTPASAEDRGEVERLARAVQAVTGDNVDIAYVDQGYTGTRAAEAAAAHGIRLEVVNCLKPSAASFSCPGAGSSNGHSLGQPAFADPSTTMSAMHKHSLHCTSWLSHLSCSDRPSPSPHIHKSV